MENSDAMGWRQKYPSTDFKVLISVEASLLGLWMATFLLYLYMTFLHACPGRERVSSLVSLLIRILDYYIMALFYDHDLMST